MDAGRKDGLTSISVSRDFLVLTQDVVINKIIPGRLTKNLRAGKVDLKFPVTGGAIDMDDFLSEITHSGGFNLRDEAGRIKVSVTDVVINIPEGAAAATASALITVNGDFAGRVELFALDFPDSALATPFTTPKSNTVVIKNAEVKLTVDGAAALNNAFAVTIFDTTTVVGTAKISVIVAKKSL